MQLDDRKKRILKAIIEEYVGTAEPVSSSTLVDNYGLKLSSATIRNEMAFLEQDGFLEKTHTSSGRVPSSKGYRFYVDKLLKDDNLSFDEIQFIRNSLQSKADEIEDITKKAIQTLSEVTHYTSLAVGPKAETHKITDIKLVLLGKRILMAIILTDTGIVKETIIKFEADVSEMQVEKLNYIFNAKLRGRTLGEIDIPMQELIMSEMEYELQIIKPIIEEINKVVKNNCNVYLEGKENVFNFPEFNNVDSAKQIFNILETKEFVSDICKGSSANDIEVYIGNENEYEELKNLTVVLFKNTIDGKDLGTIGIIGPTRMDYSKVISVMKYINFLLHEKWQKLEDENDIEGGI